jgi:hypothetical protein
MTDATARRRTLISDPDVDFDEGQMEFRLTYEGPLRSSNIKKDRKVFFRTHKHTIRVHFHEQLKKLWAVTPCLQTGTSGGPDVLIGERGQSPATTVEELSKKFAMYGFNFVPLVTAELGLLCAIDVLYLRREEPGALIQSTGDIDNRLKTLFDALQIPDANQGYEDMTPSADQVPLFCLLENDRLVTKVTVETDILLGEVENVDDDHENDARLVLTVRIRPREMHLWNIQFG